MSKHTPEPWVATRNCAYWEIGIEVDGYYANRIGDVCATDPHNPDSGKQEANSARIVACVNACAGMDDPAAEISRLRADINSASNALRILYANLKTATTAMERCGLTAMVDGIRADIVTEPCVSALSKAVPKEEI